MSLLCCHQGGEMKIKHVTYDKTHPRRSMARRASDTSAKIMNYFCRCLALHSDADFSLQGSRERPGTIWPQYGTETSIPDEHPEMTAYLTQQHRVGRAARKDEILTISANSCGCYLPLKETHRGAAGNAPLSTTLRRKANFVKENGNIKSTGFPPRPRTADDKIHMEKLYKLRQAMKEGRMEQVIPPRQQSNMEGSPAPPPIPSADPTPRVSAESSRGRSFSRHGTPAHARHSSPSRRTKSSSMVREYIRTSIARLDQKRKEVQGKFKAPFEHLSYPSFSTSQQASSSSEESFFCVGENHDEQRQNTRAVHALKSNQYGAANESRLSGEGVSPWTYHAPDYCKLCKTFTMTGIQGLCRNCEADFYRHKARDRDSDSDYEDDLRSTPPLKDEDDIRPTPPLKDAKILSMRKQPHTGHYFQVDSDSLEDERASIAFKYVDMGSRPIFNPVPARQFSHKAVIVDEDESERCQIQGTVERWSTGHDGAYSEEKDDTPLLRRNGKGLQRDTNFYGFYDDVLGTP